MGTRLKFVVAFCAAFVLQAGAEGADYFVHKQGSDANNGASRATPFLTIQRGVDALKPGDTLTIGPGEYSENVQRTDLGSSDADTVIRAEIPGTALLRGDVPAPEFKKIDGYRFVYGAAFEKTPLAVLEHDTLSVLMKRPNIRDVEYEPGTFYYDADRKLLYMSTSGMHEPTRRRYTVSVAGTNNGIGINTPYTPAAVRGNNGLELISPQRVVTEGLAVTGFYLGWGINLTSPVSCVVRDCVTYMSLGGICLADGGSNNLVENCESYGHTFGGIVRYRANNDVIRNCRTYRTKHEGEEYFGIMHYRGTNGPLLIKDNISWGQNFDYSVKPPGEEKLENCVGLGSIRNDNSNVFHNLIGGGNEYDRGSNAPADSILFLREKKLDRDFEFVDPLNLDFRLQPDSRFRGTAPDGSDRGPYQYEANIFYVSPAGDDGADGLSMRKPWRTLARSLRGRQPGDTVYLTEGQYAAVPWNKPGDGKSPIRILGRGRGTVVITGRQVLTGGKGIVIERLSFAEGVALNDCRDVEFKNCTFFGNGDGLNGDGVENLEVTHSVFAGVPVNLTRSEGVTLSGNVYANAGKPAVRLDGAGAIRYSDYNSYQDAARCWEVAGATASLADVRRRHDRYSQTLAPEFLLEEGAPRIRNDNEFKGRGPHSTALGIHYDYDAAPKALKLVGPFLHSVSDTTANIEWWTSDPATFELAWGETPEMTNRAESVQPPDSFTTYSLTGLKPGTTYYFKIRAGDSPDRGAAMSATVLDPKTAPLSFATLAVAPKPATYYVAPDGDDARSGLSRKEAWRTVSHAADMAAPGDTVLIAGGTYSEDVRIRATGDEGKPITFRCIPGEKVVFNGRNLAHGVKAVAKKHLNFDGFYFVSFKDSPVFVLWQGDDVRITRCFNVKGTGYGEFISAKYSADVLVKNCVAAQGMGIAELRICPGWRMENNLFLKPFISTVHFTSKPDQKGYLRKTIITDSLPTKVHTVLLTIGRFESFVEEDNCYFLRVPDEQRKMFHFYGIADHADGTENDRRMSLKEYQGMVGDTGSYVGDPKFAGTANMKEDGTRRDGQRVMMFDRLIDKRDLDFPDTFATDPRAVEKGIGPQPDDFKDFWFNKKK